MTNQQFIQHLKKQPRHGFDFSSFVNGVGSAIDALSAFGRYSTQALDAAKKLSEQLIETGEKGFKGLLESQVSMNLGLSKTIEINQVLQTKFLALGKAAAFVEERNAVLNKGFGISSKNAAELSKKFIELSKENKVFGNQINFSGEAMNEFAINIKKMLPTYNQLAKADSSYYKSLQQSQAILIEGLGLTEEQANSFTQFTSAGELNAARQLQLTETIAKSMGDADGKMGYMKLITEGIAEAGADIQLQYGRLPGSLEQATIKAARLGLKLEDLAGAGESLLDIESSIGKELEYQLLTGRQLTNEHNQSLTNLYREATLRGDANDQANILNEIIEKEGGNLEKNLFARKQMADLLGIQEQQLASAIQKQKILQKAGEQGIPINIDDNGSIERAAEALKNKGELTAKEFDEFMDSNNTATTETLLKEQLSIANEQLMYTRMDVQSNREQLIKAAKQMAAASTGLSKSEYDALGKSLTVLGVPQAAATEIVDSATKATVDGAGSVRAKKGNDLIATPTGYGDRILLAGEDTFALNNDDTVVAGTNLFPKSNSGNTGLASKIDELIAEIRNQTRILSKRDNTFGAGINSAYYG